MQTSIARNIAQTFAVRIAIFAMVVFNNVLVSRWLGPEALGVMATFLMFADAVNKATGLGQESAILYFVGNRRFPERDFLGTLLPLGALVYLSGSLLIIAIVQFGGLQLLFEPTEIPLAETNAYWCIFLLFAAIFHEYGGNIWLGRQQYWRYNGNLLFRPLVYLIVLLLFYFSGKLTATTALIIYGISWLAPGIYIWFRDILPVKIRFRREIIRESLRYGSRMMGARLLEFLIFRQDIFLVGYFCTQSDVGWYYVAVMIVERLLYFAGATETVLVPAAARTAAQREKVPTILRVNVLVIFAGIVVLAIVAPFFVPLFFGDAFEKSVPPLLALLPGMIAAVIIKLLLADFAASGKPHLNLVVNLANFLINLSLNLLLIPRIGILGAALASSISYGAAAILALVIYRQSNRASLRSLLLIRRNDFRLLRNIRSRNHEN